jgi:RNA polymerase sigma-70 factor (ECF subfamily)
MQKSKYHLTEEELLSEQEQVELAKEDPAKFAPLYHKYHEPIFRFIYQRLDDKQVAFDLCSQVFLKALQQIGKYSYRGVPFSAWLYRIALNEVRLLFRSEKSRHTINIETANLDDMIDEMEEDRLGAYHEKMITAISGLAEDDLHLIEMRFFEKKSFREIGEIIDITENNAKVRTYRVLDKLKQKIVALPK